MNCREEGFIQAFLDGECGAEEGRRFTEHLRSCEMCQMRLNELSQLQDWTNGKLDMLASSTNDRLNIDADAAWQRFSRKLGNGVFMSASAEKQNRHLQKRSWRNMKKSTKRWVTGVSAAAVVAVSLSFPQVQAAANDLLSIFRVNQVEFIKLTQDDLQEAERWISSAQAGELELKGVGKVWIEQPEKHGEGSVWYQSAEEALQAGVVLPKLPAGLHVDGVEVAHPFTLHLELNVEKANQLFAQLQMEERFDKKLDGERFSLRVPRSLSLYLKDGDSFYTYSKVGALQLQAPEGVDLDQLRKTVLALPFIPDNVKKQMLSIENWQETLPVPYVESEGHQIEEVNVNGQKGMLIKGENRTHLIWQEDGTLHFLDGEGRNEAKLLDLAQQLQ